MTDNTQNTQTEPKDTHQMGDYIGYVKWFNDSKGFGFVRIVTQGIDMVRMFLYIRVN